MLEPNRQYDSFNIDDDGNLTFVRKNKVTDFGNIEEGLASPSKMISKLGVNYLRLKPGFHLDFLCPSLLVLVFSCPFWFFQL